MILVEWMMSKDNKDYNTYAVIQDLDTFKEYYNLNMVEWDKLSTKQKEGYLFNATRQLDMQYRFKYEKKDIDQNLEFPRNIGVGIPKDIVHATIIMAISMHKEQHDEDNNTNKKQNYKSEKVGRTLAIEYNAFVDRDIVNGQDKGQYAKYLKLCLSPWIVSELYLCRG